MNRTSVANLRLVILNGAAFFSGVKDPLFDLAKNARRKASFRGPQRQVFVAGWFSEVKDPLFDQYASAPVVPTNYNHQRQTSRQHNPPQQTRGDGP